jgi:hypothetical protein
MLAGLGDGGRKPVAIAVLAERKARNMKPASLEFIHKGRLAGLSDVPPSVHEKLFHNRDAKDMGLARGRRQQNAIARGGACPFARALRPERPQDLLQSLQSDRNLHEVAAVIIPQEAETARGGREQFQENAVIGAAFPPQGLCIGQGRLRIGAQ